MNVGGIFNKLQSNADLIGTLIGTVSSADGIDGLINSIMSLPDAHMIDIPRYIDNLKASPEVRMSIMGWIAGYVLREFGVSQGKLVQDLAGGYIKGSVLGSALWYATHADEGCAPSGNRFSRPSGNSHEVGYAY